jgi:hypothetical protein
MRTKQQLFAKERLKLSLSPYCLSNIPTSLESAAETASDENISLSSSLFSYDTFISTARVFRGLVITN